MRTAHVMNKCSGTHSPSTPKMPFSCHAMPCHAKPSQHTHNKKKKRYSKSQHLSISASQHLKPTRTIFKPHTYKVFFQLYYLFISLSLSVRPTTSTCIRTRTHPCFASVALRACVLLQPQHNKPDR